MFGLEGVGFGSSFPELTEKMYINTYEKVNLDNWARGVAAGIDIPAQPEIVSLEEREEAVLLIVAVYTADYYPELLDPLDLRGYIDTKGSH